MRTSLLAVVCLVLLAVPAVAARTTTWNVPGDFDTIQDAMDSSSVDDGDTIRVGSGNHAGAYVTKAVRICGTGNATISSGPMHPAGLSMGFRLLTGSDEAQIDHLTFDVDLAVMNGDAVDDVEVDHCTFHSAIQAVSNWRGSGWEIAHNKISDLRARNGGGIGIMIADFSGGEAKDNYVHHNTISGTLEVWENDGGGYAGSGIVLFADFRWNRLGADAISDNRITHNTISLISDTPNVVDVFAFEMTDTRNDSTVAAVIYDNAIGFNDFRGTIDQITLTPSTLGDENTISRNLGSNRGQGAVHPSLFR